FPLCAFIFPAPAPAMTAFKFHLRWESVDWRRIIAVDVDMLQEHISMVTFCSLEGGCYLRCRNPIDPSLVKLLRLGQLSLECACDREHKQLLRHAEKYISGQHQMQMYQSENHKMSRILRKKLIIQAQREQIKSIYLSLTIKEEEEQKEEAAEEEEVPVIKSSPAPEPQQKRVSTMRPVSVPILDPIQELSEDSSTISEKSPAKTIPKPELRKEVTLTLVRLVESQRTETSGSLTEK
uniref:Cilium assembly protein DZIP1 N-terminal domain-containing protein n=1 Tax=Gouania willdenowi TaxID=441366 RepID=A0A8C5G7Q0_GOUWI